MQPLYAIRFDADSASGVDYPASEVVLAVAERWLARRAIDASPVDLSVSGKATLTVQGGEERHLDWQRIEVAELNAIRIDQVEPHEDAATVYTRVTINWTDSQRVTFRLRLGVAGDTRLVPAELPALKPPALVTELLRSRKLTCSTDGQRVDSRYLMIKEPSEADLLSDLVDSESRLPLIIVNTAETGLWPDLELPTKQLARSVSGLARVVCLAFIQGLHRFRAIRPELTPAAGDALLVWPSRRFDPEPFDTRASVENSSLMRRLLGAAVAVFGGRDEAWNTAERAQRDLEQQQLREQIADATDIETVKAAAAAQVESAEAAAAQQREEHDELMGVAFHEIDQLKVQVGDLEGEKRKLGAKLLALQGVGSEVGTTLEWSLDQELARLADSDLGTMPDLLPLLDRLQSVSGGALAITENARNGCLNSSYPDPGRIAVPLVRLADAAIAYRAAKGVVGIPLQTWLSDRGLANSILDATLVDQKLHLFVYQGRRLDRTPHIKVDDHKHPDQVGRIYFAFDNGAGLSDGGPRFVIDHIGQKLYLKEGKRVRKGRD